MGKVLIIDDSPTVVKVFQGFLSRAGHEVTVAVDGTTGLAAARAQLPHLILLDYVLPDMTGADVCRELKNDAAFNNTRVLLLTASHNEQVARAGADLFLTKDCGPGRVLEAVEELLTTTR